MIDFLNQLFSQLAVYLQFLLACLGAYLVALYFATIVWTFRDITARTRDVFSIALGLALVILVPFAGILLYLVLRPKETLSEAYERALEEEYLLQDIEDTEICPSCKRRVNADFLYCPYCRTKLREECENCGRPISVRWAACPYCGKQ
jgi:RNA polymerase subunit RPABC4/transcription elongation factor Spt4